MCWTSNWKSLNETRKKNRKNKTNKRINNNKNHNTNCNKRPHRNNEKLKKSIYFGKLIEFFVINKTNLQLIRDNVSLSNVIMFKVIKSVFECTVWDHWINEVLCSILQIRFFILFSFRFLHCNCKFNLLDPKIILLRHVFFLRIFVLFIPNKKKLSRRFKSMKNISQILLWIHIHYTERYTYGTMMLNSQQNHCKCIRDTQKLFSFEFSIWIDVRVFIWNKQHKKYQNEVGTCVVFLWIVELLPVWSACHHHSFISIQFFMLSFQRIYNSNDETITHFYPFQNNLIST